jgi:hypothetical protein
MAAIERNNTVFIDVSHYKGIPVNYLESDGGTVAAFIAHPKEDRDSATLHIQTRISHPDKEKLSAELKGIGQWHNSYEHVFVDIPRHSDGNYYGVATIIP